jgi:hypothetical protein
MPAKVDIALGDIMRAIARCPYIPHAWLTDCRIDKRRRGWLCFFSTVFSGVYAVDVFAHQAVGNPLVARSGLGQTRPTTRFHHRVKKGVHGLNARRCNTGGNFARHLREACGEFVRGLRSSQNGNPDRQHAPARDVIGQGHGNFELVRRQVWVAS